ncbi:deoxyguanosinetriphosphate triphosphohydrolase [Halorhabdus utahensis DSM 12940]|uniref:Deoxyguanosinetriphosphate triphosphohydrolase n=1 Tax=Halorhabdus utahensis (strain DSM 12940 / JCM 11049 / AX-2) TaxID=519442 RepID=C7NU83_HALUD|nr:dNTP triphosphohydrolase [Halorhabdus utahensis]ACV10980.1 deoxyguanosinetriphosphate triphosphohydrolase [Halorhabdus utahensis DSM 12940]
MGPEVSRTDRFHIEETNDRRSPFQRDRDRILHTRAFRRLGSVTQVVHADEGMNYHNRLTHSLKVAQIGQRLAEYLIEDADEDTIQKAGGLSPDVVEAAALAHDLGHPPFGHAAEEELMIQTAAKGLIGGFEGNPQSFRIVNKVATHSSDYRGLDLTYATLNAILKYPWTRGSAGPERTKWGTYHTEREIFEEVRKLPTPGPDDQGQSLEACIMDWADDIAYAIHDMSDFYKAGLIPLEQLIRDSSEREVFVKAFGEKYDTPKNWDPEKFLEENILKTGEIAASGGENPFKSSFSNKPENRGTLNFMTSELIRRYLGLNKDTEVFVDPSINGGLYITESLKHEIKLLKFLTEYYVFQDPTLVAQQRGQRKIIEELFTTLYKASEKGAEYNEIIPEPFCSMLNQDVYEADLDDSTSKETRARIVADLIASLSESQAVDLYQRVSGENPGSVTESIL